ncbi:GntR family transcriptional regulator [Gordonia sp. TBRC 11910]|uniref:GntR family transcriptional regulator n=2 Tax=Gordonia asplenii TaxID=2725283 RepID=A0A848KSB9_9ACTN|nr:GntR family transcriptional regulator [Gordonia asplenii]
MPLPNTSRPIEKAKLRDTIYDTLLEWIVDGTLEPGERIRDAELAEHLGVSRTPVREALQQLGHEGLIETMASRSTCVAPLDIAGADHLYPIVWTLDAFAVRLAAAHYGRTERDQMAIANAKLSRALSKGDAKSALTADADFHNTLAIASGNPELVKILGGLRTQLRRLELAYFHTGFGQSSVDEHASIQAALDAGDVDRAVGATLDHWQRGLERFRVGISDLSSTRLA